MSTVVEDIRNNKTITAIARDRNVSRDKIYKQLKLSGFNHQKLKFNHDFFEDIDCEEKAYWLGFVMADGCVSLTQCPKMTIKLHKKDKLHLEKWHKALKSCLRIHLRKDTVASTHYSTKMCQDLIRLGCTPRKSLTLKFPRLREDLIRHFVRGYFDGDGSICISNKQLRVAFTGTEMFLCSLKNWIKCSSNVKPRGEHNRAYGLEIHGNKVAMKIADIMYKNVTIALDRKLEVYHSLI